MRPAVLLLAFTVSVTAANLPHADAGTKPAFSRVAGWRVLPCGIELARADLALRNARIRFKKQHSMRGHFPARSDGKGGCCVQFDRRTITTGAWQGSAEFRWSRLHSLHLVRSVKSASEVTRILGALKARYGEPKLHQPLPAKPHHHLLADWSNPGAQLSIRVSLYKGTLRFAQHWQCLPQGHP